MASPCPSREMLENFFRDGLSREEESLVADHLDQCSNCRRAVDQIHLSDTTALHPQRLMQGASDEALSALASLRPELYRLAANERATEAVPLANSPQHPDHIGRFVIEKTLGEGGFGIVLLAHDPTLNRKVALKVPRARLWRDKKHWQRFLREARAAAALQHPHIVPVFDVGIASGVPYLATAYCAGPTLARWLSDEPAPPPARLAARIVRALAEAVQHAHERGVLHRDIKPANVLCDPAPLRNELPFTPQLTDFGLAKILDDGDETLTGLVFGTPRYMAPEQAAGQGNEIGPATDVYSLGAVLYELITGKPPIIGGDNADTLRRIGEEVPLAPRRQVPSLAPDLEAIVLKCLEKRPGDRYASAQDLAEDLARWLRGEPTHARPLSVIGRLSRWCRRNPLAAALCLSVLFIAISAPVAAYRQAQLARSEAQLRKRAEQATQRERSARQAAVASAEEAGVARRELLAKAAQLDAESQRLAQHLYRADMELIQRAWSEDRTGDAIKLLDRYLPEAGRTDLRTFEWHLWRSRCLEYAWRIPTDVPTPALLGMAPENNILAVITRRGAHYQVTLYDARTTRALNDMTFEFPSGVRRVELSPNGEAVLVSNSHWATVLHLDVKTVSTLGNATQGGVWYLNGKEPRFVEVDDFGEGILTPDRQWIVGTKRSDAQRNLSIWKVVGERAELNVDNRGTYIGWGESVAASGSLIFFQEHRPSTVKAMGFDSEAAPRELFETAYLSGSLRISRNGHTLAAMSRHGVLRFFDLATGELKRMVHGHRESRDLGDVVSTDDASLWASSTSGEVLVWDVTTPPSYASVPAHKENDISWMAAAESANTVITAGLNGIIQAWDASTGTLVAQIAAPKRTSRFGAISPDGKLVAIPDMASGLQFWDIGQPTTRPAFGRDAVRPYSVAFSNDGSRLVGALNADAKGRMAVWNVAEAKLEIYLDGHPMVFRNGDKVPVRIDSERPAVVTTMRFSPDGKFLATAGGGGDWQVRLWDIESGSLVRTFADQGWHVDALAFSRDGRLLASASNNTIQLFEVESGNLIADFAGHFAMVTSLAFAPDGKTLVSGSADETIRFWHLPTHTASSVLTDSASGISQIAFTSGGKTLVATSGDGRLHFWRTDPTGDQ